MRISSQNESFEKRAVQVEIIALFDGQVIVVDFRPKLSK